MLVISGGSMLRRHRTMLVVLTASSLCSMSSVAAQSLSFGVRGTGGMPLGAFAETSAGGNDAIIRGAKNGFGYGLDVGASLGMLGVYAGFDRIAFECDAGSCASDASYTLQGVAIGLRVTPGIASGLRPFLKGGVTFNSLKGAYGATGAQSLSTDRAPGFEVGVGGNIALGGLVSITPQVRYVGQNFQAKIPGVIVPAGKSSGANYVAFDLGLSVNTPFGNKR